MAKQFDPLIAEMEQEADATRRVLERVPNDKLDWRPHEKSMPLGQLARHVASIPGDMCAFFDCASLDVNDIEPAEAVTSADELIPVLEESLAKAKRILGNMDDATANGTWKAVAGDQTLMEMPRTAGLRSFMLNHWYHHRAQLGVYLRLLDVPVPSVYGPSADDNPLAEAMAAAQSDTT